METSSIQRTYFVEKIITTDKGYSFLTDNGYIQIPFSLYLGKKPPYLKLFMRNEIKVEKFFKEVIHAEFGGEVIFHPKESQYSEFLQNKMAQYRSWQIRKAVNDVEVKHKLDEQLDYFVGHYPLIENLKQELAQQPLMFQMWLKAHFYHLSNNEYSLRRLSLLSNLCQMAEQLYLRYNDPSLQEFPHTYGIRSLSKINNLDFQIQIAVEDELNITYRYSECLKFLREQKLVATDGQDSILLQHFARTLRQMMIFYVEDREEFHRQMSFDSFYERHYSDKDEYVRQWQNFKLWKLETQILPALDEQKMSDFITNFRL